jgi:hypothetical protein
LLDIGIEVNRIIDVCVDASTYFINRLKVKIQAKDDGLLDSWVKARAFEYYLWNEAFPGYLETHVIKYNEIARKTIAVFQNPKVERRGNWVPVWLKLLQALQLTEAKRIHETTDHEIDQIVSTGHEFI